MCIRPILFLSCSFLTPASPVYIIYYLTIVCRFLSLFLSLSTIAFYSFPYIITHAAQLRVQHADRDGISHTCAHFTTHVRTIFSFFSLFSSYKLLVEFDAERRTHSLLPPRVYTCFGADNLQSPQLRFARTRARFCSFLRASLVQRNYSRVCADRDTLKFAFFLYSREPCSRNNLIKLLIKTSALFR